MAQLGELKATARPRAGKGAARQARREGKVPGVIYGDGKPPETIVIDYNDLWKQVLKGHFTSTVFDVEVDGKKNCVLPRELQVDPVKDLPIHVDFMRIGKDGRIRVEVAVRFINEALSPGLKRGGVLNIVRHDIEVTCPYDKIPPYFEVDLAGLDIGRSVHISAVKLPEGVETVIKGRDFTIATIAGSASWMPAAAIASPPCTSTKMRARPSRGGNRAMSRDNDVRKPTGRPCAASGVPAMTAPRASGCITAVTIAARTDSAASWGPTRVMRAWYAV